MATESVATPEDIKDMDFPALISAQEVTELDKIAGQWQPYRRMALRLLAKSRAELVEAVASESVAEAMLEMAEQVGEYRLHLDALREQAEAMQARLFVALANYQEAQA